MDLSVIIPTLNEQEFLPGCLQSVAFASEIIIVDSGSSDETLNIAQSANATILHHDWTGFADQKNFGASKAKGDWLLFLDADERISPSLNQELQTLNVDNQNIFQLPRENYLIGKKLMHGGWYPDYQRRLVKCADFIHWQGELHENVVVKDEHLGTLVHPIVHFSHRGADWMMAKTMNYAKAEARLYFKAGHPPVKLRHLLAAVWHEVYIRGFKKSGWKDGFEGWLEIFFQSFSSFMQRYYLWEMQSKLQSRFTKLRQEYDQGLVIKSNHNK